LEESTHSHQEGEISKEAEIDVIEPEIHEGNGISNNDIPTSEAEILDNKSVNDDNFSAPASEREKVAFRHIKSREIKYFDNDGLIIFEKIQ